MGLPWDPGDLIEGGDTETGECWGLIIWKGVLALL